MYRAETIKWMTARQLRLLTMRFSLGFRGCYNVNLLVHLYRYANAIDK